MRSPTATVVVVVLICVVLNLLVNNVDAAGRDGQSRNQRKGVVVHPSGEQMHKQKIPRKPEEVIFGVYVMTNISSTVSITGVKCDGQKADPVAAGYAMAIYGPIRDESDDGTGSKLQEKIPVPGISTKRPINGPFGKIRSQQDALGTFNMFKGFMGSPEEVLTTLANDPSTPFNGVSIKDQGDYYAKEGYDIHEGIDLTLVEWTSAVTTIMVALNVPALPKNITIDAKRIFGNYFGPIKNMEIVSAKAIYGIADDYPPKYTEVIDMNAMTITLTVDKNWYEGLMAATKWNSKQTNNVKPINAKISSTERRSETLIDDSSPATSEPQTATQQGGDPLIISVEVGFESPKMTKAVPGGSNADQTPNATAPTGSPNVQVMTVTGNSTSGVGSEEEDLGSTNLPHMSIRNYMMTNTEPVSQAFRELRSAILAEGGGAYRGPKGGITVVISPVIVYAIITLAVLFTIGGQNGYPYGYDQSFITAYKAWYSKRLEAEREMKLQQQMTADDNSSFAIRG